ncbi:MAG: CRISPR-associated protein Cas1 [Spirosomataceae bacterium]|jgi:CRISPR-associated protein Cas1
MIKRSLLITNAFVLRTQHEQLILQDPVTNVQRPVPIEDIGTIVLDHHGIRITQPAVNKLLANNVSLIYCDDHSHMPSGLLLPLESNTIQSERFRFQMEASAVLKKRLWQQTIKSKIENQGKVYEVTHLTASNFLQRRIKSVKSGDTDNQEGQAARHYWANLFSPENFTRDRFGEPPNNYLNYGYAILRAATARAISGSGLLPTLGIHHHNRYNAFCLADDLMEPYRPWVDYLVWQKMKSKNIFEELTVEDKADFIRLLNADVFINNQRKPLALALTTTSVSLVKSFAESTPQLIYPEFQKCDADKIQS